MECLPLMVIALRQDNHFCFLKTGSGGEIYSLISVSLILGTSRIFPGGATGENSHKGGGLCRRWGRTGRVGVKAQEGNKVARGSRLRNTSSEGDSRQTT